ncbi:DNA alkylation repair protein [Candidatus Woesearchaeota archaeon]|nr:DNA alkylation repair protein [Candidatus Woesearchaeota archaeon]
MIDRLKKDLERLRDEKKAVDLARFFKTGKGEYGEGDVFLGIIVPKQRIVAKKYQNMSLKETAELLSSKVHEHRLTALFILVLKYKKSDVRGKEEIKDVYLKNFRYVNNWDLVDLSAPRILGSYLLDKDRSLLYKLAKSRNIWERRIAVLSTSMFIYHNQFEEALEISEMLLGDEHDLIHKAVGWMLREIGKRDMKAEEKFLDNHYKKMPRTMLRYAIEKFPEPKRKHYLAK